MKAGKRMENPVTGRYEQYTDENLMTKVFNGDTDAFNEMYKRYSKRLLYYFYRMLGNSREKSQDFLQDIFVKIIERPELYDAGRKFSTWIFSVAHNMCKNEYRRLQVRSNTVSDPDIDQYTETFDTDFNDLQVTAGQIFAEAGCLDENEKSVFLLYYKEDFSLQNIGKILSIPEGTVKSKLFYARRKLLARFNKQDINK